MRKTRETRGEERGKEGGDWGREREREREGERESMCVGGFFDMRVPFWCFGKRVLMNRVIFRVRDNFLKQRYNSIINQTCHSLYMHVK